MESKAAPPPGLYVRQLVQHASSLRREARAAFDDGDYERAAALLAHAEMLAADVGELVDAMEERQGADMMRLAASEQYDAAPTRRPVLTARTRKLGAALGASLAMSLALVEC